MIASGCAAGGSAPEELPGRPAASDTENLEAVNINTASAEELQRLPYVGKVQARRIVEYRERFGAFRRPEQLMDVQGISDRKFREIEHLIRVH